MAINIFYDEKESYHLFIGDQVLLSTSARESSLIMNLGINFQSAIKSFDHPFPRESTLKNWNVPYQLQQLLHSSYLFLISSSKSRRIK